MLMALQKTAQIYNEVNKLMKIDKSRILIKSSEKIQTS